MYMCIYIYIYCLIIYILPIIKLYFRYFTNKIFHIRLYQMTLPLLVFIWELFFINLIKISSALFLLSFLTIATVITFITIVPRSQREQCLLLSFPPSSPPLSSLISFSPFPHYLSVDYLWNSSFIPPPPPPVRLSFSPFLTISHWR